MTIIPQPLFSMSGYPGETATMYVIYDDVNRPNNPDRWRIVQMQIQNLTSFPAWMYVGDVGTNERWPDADPATPGWQPDVVAAGETRTWDVPTRFKNRDPFAYEYGGGFITPF